MTIVQISGYDVMLDDEDVERVTAWKWCLSGQDGRNQGLYYFLHAALRKEPTGEWVFDVHHRLHRFIMGCAPRDGKVVDHIDGNTLNCQKSNLRICTQAENKRNRKLNKNNTSGYKGVHQIKGTGLWRACIYLDRKQKVLGYYASPEEAYEAYKEAALKYHGEYARFK
jgi:hypothetical protein